jgi:hypothetical protein
VATSRETRLSECGNPRRKPKSHIPISRTYRDLAPLLWLRLIVVIPPLLFESKTQVVLLRGKLAVAYPTYDAAGRE